MDRFKREAISPLLRDFGIRKKMPSVPQAFLKFCCSFSFKFTLLTAACTRHYGVHHTDQ